MNLNKTEKLLAARKRLKEFQQNKNHTQDPIPRHQEYQQKITSAEASPEKIQSPSKSAVDSIPIHENQFPEIVENSQKVSALSNDPDNPNLEDSNGPSPSSHPRLVEEPREVKSCLDPAPKLDIGDETETFQAPSRIVQAHILPSPSATPPLSGSLNFSSNEIVDSPTSQKENLLRMATAVADAMIDNSVLSSIVSPGLEHNCDNEFLTACLREQKQLTNQLHAQVSQYRSRVSELEAILATRNDDYEAKLLREISPLREQLLVHARTTGILVGEKAELTSAIEECRALAKRKTEQNEELNGRMKSLQTRMSVLEKELSQSRNIIEDTRKIYQQTRHDYAELEKRHNELRRIREDDELESSELRQELCLKNGEISSLRNDLEEKNSLLSLNELRIRQLTTEPQGTEALEAQQRAISVLEQQLSQSREALVALSRDKDEAARQYESYVRQLDSRHEESASELEEARRRIAGSEEREESYIRRLSDLEATLQRERERVEKLLPLKAHEERNEHLTKILEDLGRENENLQACLNKRDAEIEALRLELGEFRETSDDNVEKSKLARALESEQLGASRAIAQNQQLKLQLSEMHDAFVTLSNSKLDLTEKLQAERAIGRKLNARLNEIEDETRQLREELGLKKVALEDAEREKLRTAQIADQMHHYQAQSSQARTLQEELQNSLGCMEILRRENQELSSRLNELRDGDGNFSNGNDEKSVNGNDGKDGGEGGRSRTMMMMKNHSDGSTMISDPLKKLEIRFKETMERVAELTDEKQRLEHLVLQLQGETETIGEYITLYQKQRGILQKKGQERERMFRQLIEQRNHLQEQLHRLKVLVADLILRKNTSSGVAETEEESSMIIDHANEKEETKVMDEKESGKDESIVDFKDKTTSKILDLLTEIKDCQDTCIVEPNFHPCPWCSGKLITV